MSPSDPTRILHTVLWPHRSLSRRGFMLVMALVSLVSFIAGTIFMLIGAWPVVGFLGLDVALVYWALKRNFVDADRHETIEVTGHDVVVRRFARGRMVQELRFARGFVHVGLEIDEERELVGRLTLDSRGIRHEIGAFLGAHERVELASALKGALARPHV